MLRAVEGSAVGGFDEWWHSLARNEYEDSLHGSADPTHASFSLFAMT